MAWCIVNSAPDNHHENKVSTTSTFFNRFKKQNFGTREFKKGVSGVSQVSVWGSSGRPTPFVMPNLSDPQHTNPANTNNLIQMSNDHVDVNGGDYGQYGSSNANGYVFSKPAKINQAFKTFGIRFGKFGHIYGTGAYYSHNEYNHQPYEIR
jgi:hypothetical protein